MDSRPLIADSAAGEAAAKASLVLALHAQVKCRTRKVDITGYDLSLGIFKEESAAAVPWHDIRKLEHGPRLSEPAEGRVIQEA